MTPPGHRMHTVTLLSCAVTLWAASLPAFQFVEGGAAVGVLHVVGAVWSSRVALRLRTRDRPPVHRAEVLRWAVYPVVVGLTAALVLTGRSLEVRWRLSRGSFEAAADRFERSSLDTRVTRRRLGLYTVEEIRAGDPGVVAFTEVHGELLGTAGFVRVRTPDGAPVTGPAPDVDVPTDGDGQRLRPLGDGWYAWTASAF